jgi:outer membrane protein OmpA-like peptidoglycan-associated protein
MQGQAKRETTMHGRNIPLKLTALIVMASIPAFAAEVKGMIISRNGDTLVVKSGGTTTTVVLTDSTTTRDKRGLFGLDKQHLSDVVLIPGLKVDVDGTADAQGRVVATTITTDGDDLETAEMVQAGLHPTAEQVEANVQAISTNQQDIAALKKQQAAHGQAAAANQQDIAANKQQIDQNIQDIEEHTDRFTALADYDVKGEATLKFNTGSSKISAADQEQLKKLAETATGLTGYIVEVTGFADATGSAEMNTKLSEDCAKAVVVFLMQQGKVPVRHIVAPGAMGEYGSVAPNETKEGRAENRRVEVKVLVNKGIAGS